MSLLLVHPLFSVALTVAAYAVASGLWERRDRPPLLHPVFVSTVIVVTLLTMLGMSYEWYFAQAALLNEGLGVVIVLLAVPLHRQLARIRDAGSSVAAALLIGSCVAIASALALPLVSGAPDSLLATLVSKSATAAVAVEIAGSLGGWPGLTAVVVISTGIFGAVLGPSILRLSGVTDERAFGFALGVAAHAIGTARAFQHSEVAGAFASLGMILNALLTILLAPVVLAMLR